MPGQKPQKAKRRRTEVKPITDVDRHQTDLAEGELDTVDESIRIHERKDERGASGVCCTPRRGPAPGSRRSSPLRQLSPGGSARAGGADYGRLARARGWRWRGPSPPKAAGWPSARGTAASSTARARDLEARGAEVLAAACDVTDRDEVERHDPHRAQALRPHRHPGEQRGRDPGGAGREHGDRGLRTAP